MNRDLRTAQAKQTAEKIALIGAGVADAIEALQNAKQLPAKPETILIGVQQELEELYLSLEQG